MDLEQKEEALVEALAQLIDVVISRRRTKNLNALIRMIAHVELLVSDIKEYYGIHRQVSECKVDITGGRHGE